MDVKSFLTGYFYTAFQLYNSSEKNQSIVEFWLHQIKLHTVNGGKMTVGINRGICPMDGNVPFAFSHTDRSAFDVVKNWTTPEIWEYLKKYYNASYGEVRISLDDLIKTIEHFGGLDLEKMKEK